MQIQRCFGCMEETAVYPCSNCGYDPNTAEHPTNALPPQTILNGRYLVGKVLGQGGFGITYIGFDLMLNTKVAIKEFYPSGQVVRNPMTRTTLNWEGSAQAQQMRRDGTETFLKEARKMARVSGIANVVTVREVFAQNETAYIAMEYIEGETLSDYLNKTGPLSWEQVRAIFLPAVTAMEQVHKAGLIHRDLSPDNLMLQPDGTVKILDLGAAKDLNINSGASSMVVAKSGFSPVEQYTQRGNSGPWTDVYAMAATMYYALTGCLPPNSIDRVEEDTIDWNRPGLNTLPPEVLAAMRAAMAISAKKRMQDMAPLKAAMEAAKSAPVQKTRHAAPRPSVQKAAPAKKKGSPGLIIGIAAAVLAVVVGAIALGGGKKEAAESALSAQLQAETEAPTETTAETSAPTAAEAPEEETLATEPAAEYVDRYSSIQPGTYVTFGSYEQDNNKSNGAEPIEWLVLDRDGDKALLISRYGLDAQPFSEQGDASWETCSLRRWLNADFLDSAFSQAEQQAILTTSVDSVESGGNGTEDPLFLLSSREVNQYLIPGSDDRICASTAYAKARGAYTSGSNKTASGEAACWWWLRSSGITEKDAVGVGSDGVLDAYLVTGDSGSIRPAMWLNLAEAEKLSSAQKEPAKPVQDEVGTYVTFGSYEQDNNPNNGAEPIEWLVLERNGNKVLVISRYGLDAQAYNGQPKSATWETSILRSWMNSTFLNVAFTAGEQKAILTTDIDNSENQGYTGWHTKGGNNTQDKIFLLSYAEANKYFGAQHVNESGAGDNIKSRVEPTAYASAQHAVSSDSCQTANGAAAGWWWLRSPGYDLNSAAFVSDDGSLYGRDVHRGDGCVRPAMWLNLAEVEKLSSAQEEPAKSVQAEVGSYLTFGSYEQDNDLTNGAEPIEWLVLDRDGSKALVVSRYGLDAVPYNTEKTVMTWEKCSLRTWLNQDFLRAAFTGKEQNAILLTDVDNGKSQGCSRWGTDGGNHTQDQVFLLSYAEANKYFGVTPDNHSNMASRAASTAYAAARGAKGADGGRWWLRSPGQSQDCALFILSGSLNNHNVSSGDVCIRPAMWLNLAEVEKLSSAQEEPAKPVSAEVGSYLTFGSYEQDNNLNNGAEPIEWLVLDRDGSKALVISRYLLDAQPYNAENQFTTWETSTLRSWMNSTFLQEAFSNGEQRSILTTYVDNSSSQNRQGKTGGDGNNTEDQLFCLSPMEAQKYLGYVSWMYSKKESAAARPTAYAAAQLGTSTDRGYVWWVRTSRSGKGDYVQAISGDGTGMDIPMSQTRGFRPAMWIDLAAAS